MKMHRSIFRAAIPAILMMLSAAVLAQDVRYNYLPGTDFTKYRTYRWVVVSDHKYPSQLIDAQIKQAIDKQLAAKGLTMVTDGTPDLYLTYQVAVEQETQWNAYGGGFWRIGLGSATATSTTINVGTLILDIYDVAAKQQVWTGTATKQMNPSKDPAKNQRNLEKAMAKLLKNYPPGAR